MIGNKSKVDLAEESNSSLGIKYEEITSERNELPISALDIVLEPHYQLGKRYEIIKPIGRGGMGIVYKAKDYMLEEIVALKLLAPGLSMNEEIVERFKRETKITRRLSHNNIVRIYDLGKFDTRWYISMEYIEGKNLKTIIQERGFLSPVEATGIIKQVLKGLEVVHNQHIINRDIKPQNILIGSDGIVKIGDFSIAKSMELNGLTNNDVMIVGSPEYMSPEQVNGEKIDNRTDIYSVGVVLYEMVTGRPPFISDTLIAIAHKQIFELPTPPKELNPNIPIWLDKIILKCLAKKPDDRYQDVGELISDLEVHRVPKINFELKKDEIGFSQKKLIRLKIIAILSVGAFLIGVGVAGYFTQRYIKTQNILQMTQKDFIDKGKKLAILQPKLEELNIIKQNLETQITMAEKKIQKIESEKKELMAKLQAVKSSGQKEIPSDMVFVEAGEFIMGSSEMIDTQPPHKVYLDAFYIDKYEVTNEEYVKFLNAIGKDEGYINLQSPYSKIEKKNGVYRVKEGYERYPVVEVSWTGADMYAKWAGKRLPTEAEWEKAAKGINERKYPWGNIFDRNRCNVGMQGVLPVGSYPDGRSPCDCYDMAGNVWEWVADWYSSDYYKNSPLRNPKGPNIGNYRVWRGGSWLGNQFTTLCSTRGYFPPEKTQNTGGFRCAKDYKKNGIN